MKKLKILFIAMQFKVDLDYHVEKVATIAFTPVYHINEYLK